MNIEYYENESSTNNNHLENLTITNSSSSLAIAPETIEAWVYWLAADVVGRWRSLPVEKCDLATIFAEVNPQLIENSPGFTSTSSLLLISLVSKLSYNVHTSLLVEIEKKYQEKIKEQFNYLNDSQIVEKLILAIADITKLLVDLSQEFSQQLKINFDTVTTKAYQNLQIYFYHLKDFGTDTAIDDLTCLILEIEKLIKNYESRYQEYELLAESSQYSFIKLSSELSQWWVYKKKEKATLVLNALFLSYKLRMESKVYKASYEILIKLKEDVETHIITVATIDRWLSDLQAWFLLAYPLEPASPNLLKDLSNRIDSVKFQQQIEHNVNVSLYEWSSLDENRVKFLKENILSQLQAVCLNHYKQSLLITEKLSNSNFMKNFDS